MTTDLFVGLHNHTDGSILDGYQTHTASIQRAVELGQPGIAVTDHGSCTKHFQLYQEATKAGINPILGMEGYLVDSIDKVRAEKDRQNSHITFLAKNNKGLSDLWKISSIANMHGKYYKPLTDWDTLRDILGDNQSGLYATGGCMLSYLSDAILREDESRIDRLMYNYLNTFGEENFFLELHTWQFIDPQTDEERKLNADMKQINQASVRIADTYGIRMIAVNDSHYSNRCDHDMHDLVWGMSTNSDQIARGETASWMMSSDEVKTWLSVHDINQKVIDDAIANTVEVNNNCHVEFDKSIKMPRLHGSKESDDRKFVELVDAGFKRRMEQVNPTEEELSEHKSRTEFESQFILDNDFASYFLITNLITDESKNRHIPVGGARGSGGGSEVAWLTRATELNPVKYGTIFERFLNPGRIENGAFPDLDIDFSRLERHSIIQNLQDTFGHDCVVGIGTLGRAGLKSALKKLAMAYKVPVSDSNKITKLVDKLVDVADADEVSSIDWKKLVSENSDRKEAQELSEYIVKYPHLFKNSARLLDHILNEGTHASGIIISDESLLGKIPLRVKETGGVKEYVTQFEMDDLKYLGYIKFDILGLEQLDILRKVQELAGLGTDPEFYYQLDTDLFKDPAIWELPNQGKTNGIFQLKTNAFRQLMKRFKATSEVDVAALVAINRPNVIKAGLLDRYIARRRGEEDFTYLHPMLEGILSNTYGIAVYQEQIMQIFQQCANYSLAEADDIRRIIGSKSEKEMAEQEDKFVSRCIANPRFAMDMPPKRVADLAAQLWDQMKESAGYGFNYSHSQAYALITCWCVYMKHHYPMEYLTACLAIDKENEGDYIREVREREYDLRPPHVNTSDVTFSLKDDKIWYGLNSVHKVGDKASKVIMENRPYTSYEDFDNKVSKREVNALVRENLISIGAFDGLPFLEGEEPPNTAKVVDRMAGRIELLDRFFARNKKKKESPDFTDNDVLLAVELELVGTYITYDPMEPYLETLNEMTIDAPDVDDLDEGQIARCAGVITKVHEILTKNGDLMAFVDISWNGRTWSLIMFPNIYRDLKILVKLEKPVAIKGKRSGESLIVDKFLALEQII